MIISRTPFRISFVGGGTDIKDYYEKGYGAVVSTAIDKYMYVAVNEKFDEEIRVSYSETEIVDNVDSIKHGIIREALRLVGIAKKIEIVTIADIPGRGTGLGSSSSLAVGLLNALYSYEGKFRNAEALANEACEIEIAKLMQPIGKQDQYIAAYGGLNYIRFNANDSVLVEPIPLSRKVREELEGNLLCFFTGSTRSSNDILKNQKKNIPGTMDILDSMREQADEMRMCLKNNDLTKFGDLLNEGWILKRKLSEGITNTMIDEYYDKARQAGALGGKISGAGGGGFLTVYCEKRKQNSVRKALSTLQEMTIKLEPYGARIIFCE